MKFRQARGVKDSTRREELAKQEMLAVVKEVFERHGFNPLQTPMIEREETLTSKYAGGQEILNEIYTFEDQGGRDLALRYDHTVPLARYVSGNRDIKLPFKRYQIGKVFRDGPVKKGRYREFVQCDADIVGSKQLRDEYILAKMVSEILDELDIEHYFEVNNRKVLDDILSNLSFDEKESVILSIDKLKKKGRGGVREELIEKGFDGEKIDKLFGILITEDTGVDVLDGLEEWLAEDTYAEVKEFIDLCDEANINHRFRPTLARGLQYYTGTIFEFFFKDSDIDSSIASGGRYDDMIGEFVDDSQSYPSVGISVGLDVLKEEYDSERSNVVDAYVIPIGVDVEPIVSALRDQGLNVDVNPENRGISKGLSFADHYNISHAILVGEDELDAEKVTVKDLESGEEDMIAVEKVKEVILHP